jgi:hypothetical protein
VPSGSSGDGAIGSSTTASGANNASYVSGSSALTATWERRAKSRTFTTSCVTAAPVTAGRRSPASESKKQNKFYFFGQSMPPVFAFREYALGVLRLPVSHSE